MKQTNYLGTFLNTLLGVASALFLQACDRDLGYLLGRERDAATVLRDSGAGRYDGRGKKPLPFDGNPPDGRRDLEGDAFPPDSGRPDAKGRHDLGVPPHDMGYDGRFPDAAPPDMGRDVHAPDAAAPDAGVPDALPSPPDALPSPDLNPSLDARVQLDAPPPDARAVRADGPSPCPGDPPFNTIQAGVCVGSYQTCTLEGWRDDYTTVVGFEAVETNCDGRDNDCDGETDEALTPPSQPCTVGVGACERPGTEYATCLGSTGWSPTYSGCDAVAGDPGIEICNDEDDDCNGTIDDIVLPEVLDNFDRPDQAGLGSNALGNSWTNYGSLDDWDIDTSAAVADWTGDPGTNPLASSEIGYRSTFDVTLTFRLLDAGEVGAEGGFVYGIDCTDGSLDGYVVRLGVDDNRTHKLQRAGVDVITERVSAASPQRLRDDRTYMMRFVYDGTELKAKLWEAADPEPSGYLLSAPALTISSSSFNTFMTITGSVQSGQDQTLTVDEILNPGGCD